MQYLTYTDYMAIDFSAQFERGPKDVVYKGVHLRNKGRHRQSRNPNTQEYGFVSWFPHPTSGNLIDHETEGTLPLAKKEVNNLLEKGYQPQPNGHMRPPDQKR